MNSHQSYGWKSLNLLFICGFIAHIRSLAFLNNLYNIDENYDMKRMGKENIEVSNRF